MGPKPVMPQSGALFGYPLREHINLKHPLIELAERIDWPSIEVVCSSSFTSGRGRPATSPRLIAGLLSLQHAFDLSDEDGVQGWVENPYWQVFTGETYLQTAPPIDPSSLTRWRKRLGQAGVEELLAATIAAGKRGGLLRAASLKTVIVDTTVAPKAVTYPTDSRLLERSREHRVKAAAEHGLKLRQNDNREAPRLAAQIGRDAHARQCKRMNKRLKTLRSRVGRVWRDIERQSEQVSETGRAALQDLLAALAPAAAALALGLGLGLGLPAAASAAAPEENPSATLDTVVISATQHAQPIQDVQASVQVIDQQAMQAYSGTSITEALRQAVGVDARPIGSNGSISIRGFSLSPGALLVNGMRRPGKYGSVNPSLLELENVDRIEVVRGPMSALYGADATGGAINIITRSPLLDQGLSGNVRLMGGATGNGQRRTYIEGATLGFGSTDLRHRVSVEHRNRGLFRYDDTSTGFDLKRLQQTYASYEGAYRITADHHLRWTLEYTDQNDTSPGLLTASRNRPAMSYTAFERERRWFGAVRYRGNAGPGVLEADLGYGSTKASTARSYPVIEYTDYQQSQGQIRYAVELGKHSLLAGGGFVHDDINVTVNRNTATRRNAYLLAQDEWSLPAQWKLLAGLRYDHFTDFGSVSTPRLSLQRAFGSWRARIGYGKAYRAPSVLEQYSSFTRGPFLITGNPDLKPETNTSWEAALSYYGTTLNADAIYYRSRVSDLINTVSQPRQSSDPASIRSRARYVNTARATLEGVELSGAWRIESGWSLLAGWEYLNAHNGITGARLTEHARQIARAGLRWEHGPWRTDLQTRHYFGYYAADPNTRGSAPFNSNFGTADIKTRYQATPHTALALGIDNLLARRQPVNFNAHGSTFDPPTRFLYLELRHTF